ncbi:MAG: hypothetical protein ACD_73C00720G0003 [uncultured bacterium]|nr:MAG: hypothetical protein ACD_73C00720G0003 [uncultured bacterium]
MNFDFESLYQKFNDPKHISPDPLELVHEYTNPLDQEIIALVVSSLSYGTVAQIIKSSRKIMAIMGKTPHQFLMGTNEQDWTKRLTSFQHRWHTGQDINSLLMALKKAYGENPSLLDLFLKGSHKNDENILPALTHFIVKIKELAPVALRNNLLADPASGSACKRLHMFLRWMVRHDKVDLGIWRVIPASKLLFPVDTHIHQISLALGLTTRQQADLKTVLAITAAFKKINPKDPVRYDFCLSRLGIKKDMTTKQLREDLLRLA